MSDGRVAFQWAGRDTNVTTCHMAAPEVTTPVRRRQGPDASHHAPEQHSGVREMTNPAITTGNGALYGRKQDQELAPQVPL